MRILRSTATAILFGIASVGNAQTSFEHQYGGTTLDVWMHPHPDVPGEFLIWTAEVGVRIRRFDTATNQETFETIDNGENIIGALHGIFISDDLRWGFAVGSDGQAYWATDLSTPSTWHRMNPEPVDDDVGIWESIWTSDWEGSVWEREAWLVGEAGTLLYKEPGTVDFELVEFDPPTPPTADFLCIDFATPDSLAPGQRHGVAGTRMPDGQTGGTLSGKVNAIYYTVNGEKWFPGVVHLPASWGGGHNYTGEVRIWAVDFVPDDPLRAYAVGGYQIGNGEGFAWYTEDGGRNWYPLYHQCDPLSSSSCPEPQLVTPDPAPCTGEIPVVQNLEGQFTSTRFATIYDVTALSDGSAVLVSYGGGVFECPAWKADIVDRANTHLFGTHPVWGVASAQSGPVTEIWASGAFGDFRSSVDGGASWLLEGDDFSARLRDISFGSDTTGWITGELGSIYRSVDGGASWEPQYFGALKPWREGAWEGIHAVDENIAVAVGAQSISSYAIPRIVFTSNGGGSLGSCGWSDAVLPNLPPKTILFDVDAPDGSLGSQQTEFWAAGYSNTGIPRPVLLHSLDAGQTWSRINAFPNGFRVRAVSALDADTVVIVGEHSGHAMAYMTEDASAGMNWKKLAPNSTGVDFPPLLDVDLVAANELLAAGEDGAILRLNTMSGALDFVPGVYDQNGATFGTTNWYQVELVPSSTGGGAMVVIAGGRGRVLMMEGGVWTEPHSVSGDTITGLSFRSPDLGWLTGKSFDDLVSGVHSPHGFGDSTVVRFAR